MADPMLMRISGEISIMNATLERLEKRLSGSSAESLMDDEPVPRKKQSVPRSKKQSGPKPGFAFNPQDVINGRNNLKKTGIDPKNASKKDKKTALPKTPPTPDKKKKKKVRKSKTPESSPTPKNGDDPKKRRRHSRRN